MLKIVCLLRSLPGRTGPGAAGWQSQHRGSRLTVSTNRSFAPGVGGGGGRLNDMTDVKNVDDSISTLVHFKTTKLNTVNSIHVQKTFLGDILHIN